MKVHFSKVFEHLNKSSSMLTFVAFVVAALCFVEMWRKNVASHLKD